MQTVTIIGAGQLGSRHLQALRSVAQPLQIQVVDPSESSLATARERFEGIPGTAHEVSYATRFNPIPAVDVAIVATSAGGRRQAVEALLDASQVRSMVLEKLLFTEPADYDVVPTLVRQRGTRAWVNCPMRVMPPYEQIRAELAGAPVNYRVTGSRFGLVTNAIHYVDHVAHLTGCNRFVVDTRDLEAKPVASKRSGYLELEGTVRVRFEDGSVCELTCHSGGTAPVLVEIFTPDRRYIVRESEGKAWASSSKGDWGWAERTATIPFQSQMTAGVVRELLEGGGCGLTPFEDSVRTHLQLLPALREHVRRSDPAQAGYPFT